MSFVIRPASEKDIPFILTGNEVIDQISTHKPKRGLNADHLRQDFFSDKPKAYLAIVEGDKDDAGLVEPVAFVLYSFFYLASEGQVIWISKVYIDPFCRKMNIGAALRDYLFKTHAPISKLYGSVVTNNKIARIFFTSLGGENLNPEFVYYLVEKKS